MIILLGTCLDYYWQHYDIILLGTCLDYYWQQYDNIILLGTCVRLLLTTVW